MKRLGLFFAGLLLTVAAAFGTPQQMFVGEGGPPAVVYDTWSATNHNSNTVLSNGNLTAAYQAETSNANVTSKSTGKWQFEVVNANALTSKAHSFGLIAGTLSNWNEEPGRSTSTVLGTAYWCTSGNGRVYEHLGAGDTFTTVSDCTNGDHLTVCADLDGLTAKFYKSTTLLKTVTLPSGHSWYLVGYGSTSGVTATANFGASAFTATCTGYSGWSQ